MRTAKRLWLIFLSGWLSFQLHAAEIQTIDLKPFTGPSPIEKYHVEWLVPQGHQVLDGVPFQISGTILLYGTNSTQKSEPARTNVGNIPIDRAFAKLHLLIGAQAVSKEGVAIGQVILQYADGSSNALPIRFGEHVRSWTGSWHEKMLPVGTNSHIAWQHQSAAVAASDTYLRLFHVTLDNPAPEKKVQSISLKSSKANSGLMIVALSTGPAVDDKLPDTVAAPKSPYPDLRPRNGDPVPGEGYIFDKDGKPLANVTVIVSASRKLNSNDEEATIFHPAVGLRTNTGSDGKFSLPSLPDDQLYRLLIVASGFDSMVYPGMDPKSDPIEVRLVPSQSATPKKFAVHGKIIGLQKQPIPWALIKPDGVGWSGGRGWGYNRDFAQQVISDTNGEFTFSRDKEFISLQVNIQVPGFAPLKEWINVTNKMNLLQLDEGAVLQGRVVKDGQPLANMDVGVSAVDRNSEVYKGHYQTRTDTNGVFHFIHLPAFTSWNFFGTIASFRSLGALPSRKAMTSAPGQTNDSGDLPVVPGLRLAGRVQTRHGEPLPENFKLHVSPELAWDYQSVTVDETGAFEVTGLYAGQVEINCYANNWRLRVNNRSLDHWNPSELTGRLEKDKTDLLISLERGQSQYDNSNNGQLPSQDWPQNLPLEGAELSGDSMIELAGQVVDDKTGQPVLAYKIIPGYIPPSSGIPPVQRTTLQKLVQPLAKKDIPWNERPYRMVSHTDSVTNGHFSTEYRRLTSRPFFQIEAYGYEPLISEPFTGSNTNLVIRLVPGHGPNGVVLLPNGQPAEKAFLIYGVAHEQFSLNPDGTFSDYNTKRNHRITLFDGQFSFPAFAGGHTLFVAHPAGWAEKNVENDSDALKLRLQPWAAITGILVDTNGLPVVGETIKVTAFEDWHHGAPLINLQIHTTTDAKGYFLFTNVPPRFVEIQRIVPSSGFGSGGSYRLQTTLRVEPGITNDIGKIILDTPPPPGTIEKLKKKLGL